MLSVLQAALVLSQQRREQELAEARSLCEQVAKQKYAEELAALDRRKLAYDAALGDSEQSLADVTNLRLNSEENARARLEAEHKEKLAIQQNAKLEQQVEAAQVECTLHQSTH